MHATILVCFRRGADAVSTMDDATALLREAMMPTANAAAAAAALAEETTSSIQMPIFAALPLAGL